MTVKGGGILINSSAPLYLDGSRGATINAGGRIIANSGSTIELGGLLVNNGMQGGVLNVNLGGVARGTGSFRRGEREGASGFQNARGGGSFSVVRDGNNLDLLFSPEPEPGTWALLLVGVGTCIWRRRRRGHPGHHGRSLV